MSRPRTDTADTLPFRPGHPLRASTIAHAGLDILGPLTGDQLDALLDAAGSRPTGAALDIGCGKGDLLVRLASRGLESTGVDRNQAFLARAAELTDVAGVSGSVRLVHGDAATFNADAPYDLVAAMGSTGALGGPVAAPGRLASLARPGGAVLIGEGFWRRRPKTAELASFGMDEDELVDREATLERMTASGLVLLAALDATPDGWDAYEVAYAEGLERWASDHPSDPDAPRIRALAELFADTWQVWRREAMGFVAAVLRVPAVDFGGR